LEVKKVEMKSGARREDEQGHTAAYGDMGEATNG
jgi:hypothetical protein